MRLRCECGRVSEKKARGWRAYLAGGYEGESVEVVVLCPGCAVREFGARRYGFGRGTPPWRTNSASASSSCSKKRSMSAF